MAIKKSITELVGNTPLLELTHIEAEENIQATLLAKLESFNPAGSVKDRVAKAIIEDAEKTGRLNKGSVIIEPTSGNTGIGLASVATAKGYRTIIVMPETMSNERKMLIKAYGAELVLTEGSKGMKGASDKAEELSKEIPNSIQRITVKHTEHFKFISHLHGRSTCIRVASNNILPFTFCRNDEFLT